jgi:diguanylate cyclase (GGDEF)-like protein/PAS domain S-box-containing protein
LDPTFYKQLLDNLHDGVYFVDRNRVITYWNRGAERITGYSTDEVMGKCCKDNILMHVDEKGTQLCQTECPLSHAMEDGLTREATAYLHHREGHRIPIHLRVNPIKDSHGAIVGAVEVFNDNSANLTSYQRAQELEKVAFVDTVTDVGNRRYTEINLEARFNEQRRYGWNFGVLFFDVDYFKNVNDRHGHDVGDAVLRMVARTLAKNLRSFDFMGRWGGEEFLGIIVNVGREQLQQVASNLRSLVESSILTAGDQKVNVTVSIGATMAEPEDSLESLIRRADKLMYQSKSEGRNRVTLGDRVDDVRCQA